MKNLKHINSKKSFSLAELLACVVVVGVAAGIIAGVNASTFDDNILPGADSTYDIGISNTRWQDLFLAGELLVGTDNLFVSNAGNIGIGTVSPLAVLHLVSTSTNDLFRIDDDGSDDVSPFLIDQYGNVSIGGLLNTGTSTADSGGQNGSIYYNTASSVFRGYTAGSWADLDTRCDVSGVCSQVCIGTDCKTSWPTGGGTSPWTQSGDDIYYDTGKVGIGTSTPISSLSIEGGGITIGNTLQQGSWHSRIPKDNIITTLDSGGITGYSSSVIIGTDGLPIISYYNTTNNDLKTIHCANTNCSTFDAPIILDSIGDVGQLNSIAIGTDGLPIISYLDFTNYNLKVAHCSDVSCSSATLTTIDSTGNVGSYTSITIGTDGLPIISYYDLTNDDLKVVHCSEIDCSNTGSNTITTMDSGGRYTSIAIGTDGLPIISYYYTPSYDLKIVHCSEIDCSNTGSNTITTMDSGGILGEYTSITIGTDGLPIISYYDNATKNNLKVAHCSNISCSSSTLTTVDSTGDVGLYTSIAIGTDGLPIISYWDADNYNLKVIHCANTSCSSYNTPIIITAAEEGSIIIGTDGLPIISYFDNNDADLKVIHCANPYCIPYWTRR